MTGGQGAEWRPSVRCDLASRLVPLAR